MKKRIKFKQYYGTLQENTTHNSSSLPYTTREYNCEYSMRCYGQNEELYTTLLCHDTTYANRNPSIYHPGIQIAIHMRRNRIWHAVSERYQNTKVSLTIYKILTYDQIMKNKKMGIKLLQIIILQYFSMHFYIYT